MLVGVVALKTNRTTQAVLRREILVLLASIAATGCIGGRFEARDPGTNLDQPSRAVIDLVGAERSSRKLSPANLVPELRPPAVRAALSVARGDQSLKSAARYAAQDGVTEIGRHVWSFATECADLQRFRPPPLALAQQSLLLGAAAIPGQGGRTVVMLLIAEPGTSSLRADQMGGGRGGTNPRLESYAHPSVATGACGETWPAAQQTPF